MKSPLIIVCCLLMVCVFATAQEPCPQVIPALQQWKGGKGELALPAEGSIVLSPADEATLSPTAQILAQDLKELFGWNYVIKTGKPAGKDICLSLSKPDKELGEEGYTLTVNRYAGIAAPTGQGVFWGTRTLLQILHNEQGKLPKGTARDYPLFPNRGFMLDVARKFFTMDYLKQYVKILSFYKMNEFQIHLNDNGFPQFFGDEWNRTYAAFRLESERFPGLTAKDGSYSKQEFIDLQRMGLEYGVRIIPEIDIPAHSLAFAHYKPEIASRKYGMDHLDLYKKETYQFVDSLLDEYLSGDNPVFIGDLHIGTDEYNKKEAEQYRYFTDRYLKFVEKYGKNVSMWGGLKWLPGKTPVKAEGVTTETLADLDACCRQKHIKSKQYDHFAETARAEQRPGAEHLFRAMAFSARLHEYNCANAIVRLGGRYTPPEKVTVFRGTTDQNLQRSIDYERRTPDALHAGEIDRALAAGNRYAARVLIWSKAGDVRHRALMARYIATGDTGHEAGYRICPVCGNIYAAEYCDPFCPQCLTDGREFVRIGE